MNKENKDFQDTPAQKDEPTAAPQLPVAERVTPNPNPVINVGDEEIEQQRRGGPGQLGEVEVK